MGEVGEEGEVTGILVVDALLSAILAPNNTARLQDMKTTNGRRKPSAVSITIRVVAAVVAISTHCVRFCNT